MINRLTSELDFQTQALVLRSERQRLIASNIANADTPGYVARDLNFRDAMANAISAGGPQGAAPSSAPANARHIALSSTTGELGSGSALGYAVQTQPSLDRNSVDLDRERGNFVDNAVRYESTLRFINGYSKTILSAIQGQ